jgi:predicted MPP superfamily phosphohydrolase
MTEDKKNTRTKRYQEEKPKEEIEIEEDKEFSHPLLFKCIIAFSFLVVLILIYSFLICPKIFKINEYKVESTLLPENFNGLKIIQLADIHYGTTINKKQLDKIVKNINLLKPDIIVFTGDLIDKNISPTEDIKKEIIESLGALNASLYKYSVYGNEDKEEYYEEIMNNTGFTILKNEGKLLFYKGNNPIEIIGFNPIDTNPDYSIITNPVDEIDTTNLYKIIITHESNTIEKLMTYNPDLILTSSTLGGVIKLPFLKPLILNKYNDKYYEEHYTINTTEVYVSNGLGTTNINARFNNNPSINFYRLYHLN